jgi:hypothetical protein
MGEKSLFMAPCSKMNEKSKSSLLKPIELSFPINNPFDDLLLENPVLPFDFQKVSIKMNFDYNFISQMFLSFSKYIHSIIPEIEDSIIKYDKTKLLSHSNSLLSIFAYLYASKGLNIAISIGKAANIENFINAQRMFLLLKE